ncbi:hypothetical protein GDO78_023153 [Eleutherodactylus coqui]|uniref:Uncharacterized protein n=1 Tax=Eleutherodactylus coqui TaxID=57060 RepID=A0A8J6BHN4_ELECQ|nr:hypothetical protein GDO78_023153 [Eleutherodactylus coqui]
MEVSLLGVMATSTGLHGCYIFYVFIKNRHLLRSKKCNILVNVAVSSGGVFRPVYMYVAMQPSVMYKADCSHRTGRCAQRREGSGLLLRVIPCLSGSAQADDGRVYAPIIRARVPACQRTS